MHFTYFPCNSPYAAAVVITLLNIDFPDMKYMLVILCACIFYANSSVNFKHMISTHLLCLGTCTFTTRRLDFCAFVFGMKCG